ncbi:MAG: FHA domain-containing protein [Armatimonadaceae bacterium]
MVLFPDDDALADSHARLVWRGADLMLEPEHTTNGVYLRLRSPVRLQSGDEFLVGAQRLLVLALHAIQCRLVVGIRPTPVRRGILRRFAGRTATRWRVPFGGACYRRITAPESAHRRAALGARFIPHIGHGHR